MNRLPLVVVSQLGDLPEYGGPQLSAEAFLAGDLPAESAGAPVVNLCRSWRYLSDGYYVSLLAEARGDEVVPSPGTIVGMRSPHLVQRSLDEGGVPAVDTEPTAEASSPLPAAIARAPQGEPVLVLQPDAERVSYRAAADAETAQVVVVLGAAANPSFRRIAAAAHRVWPAPLLRLDLLRDQGRWKVVRLAPLALVELSGDERGALARRLEAGVRAVVPVARPHASLAVLYDPEGEQRPSSPETIERLEKVAGRLGLHVQRIGPGDLGRLGEFDALLVRVVTGPDLPSFAFALQAEALGMPVVDDTASILRCCNKVYLHELLGRGGVPVPQTRVVTPQTDYADLARQLGTPVVVKLPDGSFSAAVFKVNSAEDYAARTGPLFDRSPLLLAQRFLPTAFDWRVTLLGGEVLFACRYHMARGHWQVACPTRSGPRFGRTEAVAIDQAPPRVIEVARQAAALVGRGLYGVDLKELDDGHVVVIEVNDNPNIDVGYEDAAAGDAVYEALARFFLARIRAGFVPDAAPRARLARREEDLGAWRQPIEAAPAARLAPPYPAYGVCGLELEYAVVDRDLNVASLVEPALATLAGRATSDVSLGAVGLSNEIVDHVLELKTEAPLASLLETEAVLVEGVRRVGALLADRFRGARLLPTGMHPWLVPERARLWQRSGRKVYRTYERLFDTLAHGWRNVQSCHVNLPFGSEAEAIAMLNASALLVPYLPAVAASTPLVEGELGPAVCNRVAHLLTHQVKLPESQAELVPEFARSFAHYRRDVLGAMYRAVDRLPGSRPIRREFLNARGAVLKFSRTSMEVRIVDVQECVRLDVAIAAYVRWALCALARELASGALALPDHALLVADLRATAQAGSLARVHAPFLSDLPRGDDGLAPVEAVTAALVARARAEARADELPYLDLVERVARSGTLSERIAAALRPHVADDDAFTETARRIYIELADCLLDNEPWRGRGWDP